jgi:ACS family D-galactonate transporter-like MFS transporter
MIGAATPLTHPAATGALVPASRIESATRRRVVNVAVVFVCQAFHSLTFVGLALFLPLIREDLQISYAQAGVLSAAATLSYALGQIPAGYLADRLGPRRLFFVGLLGWSILSMTLGLIHTFWLAVLNQFVAGAFRALLFAPGLSLLASYFPRERGATAMSLYMLGAYTGNIVLALAGPALATALDWRSAFMVFAAVGVTAAIGFYKVGGEPVRSAATRPFVIAEALRLLRHKVLWVCSALQIARFSAVTGFIFWLPSLLVADRGFSLQAVGLVVAMGAALSAVANPLGGYLSDRLGNPPVIIGVSLAGLACTCALLVWAESLPALLLMIAFSSIFMQIYFGPLFFVPVELLGQRAAGTVVGFSNLFANLGGLATAYALGVVKDVTGSFKWGFLGISALCVVGVALSIVLAKMRRQSLPRHSAVDGMPRPAKS